MQSEVSQKQKDRYPILTHTCVCVCVCVCLRKMILINLFSRQEYRCRHREQTYEGRREWDELED